jgi:hypothetical protein
LADHGFVFDALLIFGFAQAGHRRSGVLLWIGRQAA